MGVGASAKAKTPQASDSKSAAEAPAEAATPKEKSQAESSQVPPSTVPEPVAPLAPAASPVPTPSSPNLEGVAEAPAVSLSEPALPVVEATSATPSATVAEEAAAKVFKVDDLTATGQALVEAIEAEDWTAAEKLLNERPEECDVNARTSDWHYCLLRAAAEEGARETCRKLLEHKADVNARDQNNMTPLMGCIVGGDYNDIVQMLLEAGADTAASTDDGFTALKWATRLNRQESIQLLRAAGVTGASSAFT
ncbi:unnamed protein product [Cladocopium goreaui]|uniref:Fibronectin type 3 and ankyrin repeat domains 1 protein n=1 Tax=Cladocopium goreaui TaxID=2562237 RepID=A0A9P1DJC9_9DINO|nr:unnamed protein product [Cladocopium goreaui]